MMFEGASHRYLIAHPNRGFTTRSLTGAEKVALDMSRITGKETFDPRNTISFDKIDSKMYYLLSANPAGIDSFVLEVDESQNLINPVFFHFATCSTPGAPSKYLQKIWEGNQKWGKWRLIFVVPKQIENSFVAQKWMPASEGEKWEKRVDQYVLGVDTTQLWT